MSFESIICWRQRALLQAIPASVAIRQSGSERTLNAQGYVDATHVRRRKRPEAFGQPFLANSHDHPDDTDVALPFLAKAAEVESWVKLLTAALLWSFTGTHETASDWDNASVFSPSYFPGSRNVDLTPELLAEAYDRNLYAWRNLEETGNWRHGWQPEPVAFPAEIYRFDVCLATSNGRRTAVFKPHFFSAHPYYVRFETSEETIARMSIYLEAEADRLRAGGIVLAPALLPPTRYRKN